MQKRVAVLGALACALALFSGARAEASYTYQSSVSITSATGGATIAANGLSATLNGVTITFTNEGRSLLGVPGAASLNIGDITVTAAVGTPLTSFNVTILDTIGITNNPGPGTAGSGNLTTTDTIVLSNVSNTGGQSSGSVTDTGQVAGIGSATIGGVGFTFAPPPPFTFSNVTVNGSGGNLGANVTTTAPSGVIPAPASLVMFGLGIGALGVIRLRRRFLSA